MSAAAARAPSRARRRAVARPMPEPAPVTTAVLPVKRPGVNGGEGTSLELDMAASSPCLVGMPGFEPGASTSRTWRAAKLRYIPFRGGSVPQAAESAGGGVGEPGQRPLRRTIGP